jgi:hypothetical protein
MSAPKRLEIFCRVTVNVVVSKMPVYSNWDVPQSYIPAIFVGVLSADEEGDPKTQVVTALGSWEKSRSAARKSHTL